MSKADCLSVVLWLLSVLLMSGCTMTDERRYDSLNQMKGTDDYSIVSSIKIPDDARNISVRYHVESDHYLLSYETLNEQYAINALALSETPAAARDLAVKLVGSNAELPEDVVVYARCRESSRAAPPDASVPKEVLLLANAKGRQYQWNAIYNARLELAACL